MTSKAPGVQRRLGFEANHAVLLAALSLIQAFLLLRQLAPMLREFPVGLPHSSFSTRASRLSHSRALLPYSPALFFMV